MKYLLISGLLMIASSLFAQSDLLSEKITPLKTYDKDHFEEKEVSSVGECFPIKEGPLVTWIDIDGTHDLSLLYNYGSLTGVWVVYL